MRILYMDRLKAVIQSLMGRQLQRVPNALIIGGKAHDPRDQSFIRSMPAIGLRKRTMQIDFGPDSPFPQDLARNKPEPYRPGRVRAGGSNHHRTNDIKNAAHTKITTDEP